MEQSATDKVTAFSRYDGCKNFALTYNSFAAKAAAILPDAGLPIIILLVLFWR